MRKQSQRLKDICDPALLRRQRDCLIRITKDFFAQRDAPRIRRLQSSNAIEQCRLTCSRRTEQNSDAWRKLLRNLQIETRCAPCAEFLANGDSKHWRCHLPIHGDHTRRLIA